MFKIKSFVFILSIALNVVFTVIFIFVPLADKINSKKDKIDKTPSYVYLENVIKHYENGDWLSTISNANRYENKIKSSYEILNPNIYIYTSFSYLNIHKSSRQISNIFLDSALKEIEKYKLYNATNSVVYFAQGLVYLEYGKQKTSLMLATNAFAIAESYAHDSRIDDYRYHKYLAYQRLSLYLRDIEKNDSEFNRCIEGAIIGFSGLKDDRSKREYNNSVQIQQYRPPK